MSQSSQPRMQNKEPRNTPISRIGTATVPFSQGIVYQPDITEQTAEQVTDELQQEKIAENVEPETQGTIPLQEEATGITTLNKPVIDFVYGRSMSTSFCMRCGGQAAYFGKSVKLNFSKKLCAECVAYYSNTLNV